jgi:hypothetical protein
VYFENTSLNTAGVLADNATMPLGELEISISGKVTTCPDAESPPVQDSKNSVPSKQGIKLFFGIRISRYV